MTDGGGHGGPEGLVNGGRVYGCGRHLAASSATLLDHLGEHRSRTFSRAAWARRIRRGQVWVSSSSSSSSSSSPPSASASSPVTDPAHPLARGDEITYHRPPWREPAPPAGFPHVVYSDEHLLAVNKPGGLPCMPSQTFHDFTVLRLLRSINPAPPPRCPTDQRHPQLPIQPVHRLGVGTSGTLLCARTQASRRALSAAIREHRVRKTYRALVRGADIPDFARIACPIGPVPFPIRAGTLNAARPEGGDGALPSLSLAKVVQRDRDADTAIVEVTIPTGRPHQIRIHMAYIGHPLVGDPLYLPGGTPRLRPQPFPRPPARAQDFSSDEDEGEGHDEGDDKTVMRVPLPRDCGYFLHAFRVELEHPVVKGRLLSIQAPPPPELRLWSESEPAESESKLSAALHLEA